MFYVPKPKRSNRQAHSPPMSAKHGSHVPADTGIGAVLPLKSHRRNRLKYIRLGWREITSNLQERLHDASSMVLRRRPCTQAEHENDTCTYM